MTVSVIQTNVGHMIVMVTKVQNNIKDIIGNIIVRKVMLDQRYLLTYIVRIFLISFLVVMPSLETKVVAMFITEHIHIAMFIDNNQKALKINKPIITITEALG